MILPIRAATVRATANLAVPPAGTIPHHRRRRRPSTRAYALAIAMVLGGSATQAVIAAQPEPSSYTKNDPRPDPKVDAAKTGRDAEAILRKLMPARSDTPADWHAPFEGLHAPGEPRALPACVPPPPCDPSQPPHPFDLVGVPGSPTCGPIYRGPCEPRSKRHHKGVFSWYHHMSDGMFDHFYRSK